MAPAHSASDLAEFQDGETRLVFARHRQRPDDLFYLEDGTAKIASLRVVGFPG